MNTILIFFKEEDILDLLEQCEIDDEKLMGKTVKPRGPKVQCLYIPVSFPHFLFLSLILVKTLWVRAKKDLELVPLFCILYYIFLLSLNLEWSEFCSFMYKANHDSGDPHGDPTYYWLENIEIVFIKIGMISRNK